jgi:putative addiction module component (TIGR02574 family)
MNMTVEQIVDEALGLPSEARALLADRLVESLDPAEDGYVRQLWVAEALRRREEVRSGRVHAIPAEQAFAQVRRALGR